MLTWKHLLAVSTGLAACAPATAQTPAGETGDSRAPAPNVYEVSQEHADALAALRGQAQDSGFLEVTGTGSVAVPADRARVVFAVETQSENAAGASTENATRMTAVVSAVRGTGIPGLSLETFGYALSPVYDRPSTPDRGPVITGYRATNHMTATVGDVQAVGRLIDAAIGAGANRIESLAFEASDTEEARAEALRMAVRRASAEAAAIADALGVRLGAPLEVRGGANIPGPRPVMAARVEMAADTPVEAGSQQVMANVTIRYRLAGS